MNFKPNGPICLRLSYKNSDGENITLTSEVIGELALGVIADGIHLELEGLCAKTDKGYVTIEKNPIDATVKSPNKNLNCFATDPFSVASTTTRDKMPSFEYGVSSVSILDNFATIPVPLVPSPKTEAPKPTPPSPPVPERVIFNNPATVVYWKDGTKTVVKAFDEYFDEEKGLAMAYMKKIHGNKGNYNDIFREWLEK